MPAAMHEADCYSIRKSDLSEPLPTVWILRRSGAYSRYRSSRRLSTYPLRRNADMNFHVRCILIAMSMLLPFGPAFADEYSTTRQMFEDAGASDMFESAYGYALFPTIAKAGFWIGGAYGEGRVYQGGKHIGGTAMTQATIGFQLGGSAFSQVIFFEDQRALDEFTRGTFEFGAEAQAVVITAAASASANTSGSSAGASGGKNNAVTAGDYYKGMATFTITKGGLMYEASIGGQKFTYEPYPAGNDSGR